MAKENSLANQWEALVANLSTKFADGDLLQIDAILYLIGVQELGQGVQDFSKDDKINLMHIAVCKVLEPYGYYEFSHRDNEAWPHFNLLKKLPNLKATQQTELMQEAILGYFNYRELLE